jgi:hypothetical protein
MLGVLARKGMDGIVVPRMAMKWKKIGAETAVEPLKIFKP